MNLGFPKWAKVVWWLLLLVALTTLLARYRLSAIASADPTPFDIVAFLVWIALLLAPLVSELSVFGLTLKAEVEKLKAEVRDDLAGLRAEIHTVLDVRNTQSTTIQLPAPASDATLSALEERIVSAFGEALRERDTATQKSPATIEVPPEAQALFAVRYAVEREIRRIADVRDLDRFRGRPVPVTRLVASLADHGFLAPDVASAVRETYLITSRAIHADELTPAQVTFVRDIGGDLVETLRRIE